MILLIISAHYFHCLIRIRCQKYLDIYVMNPEVCRLLILKDEENEDKIRARALVWKLDDDSFFMDRIYYTEQHEIDIFIQK